MKIIPLTRGMEAAVSDEDFDYLNQWSWSTLLTNSGTYACRGYRENGQQIFVYMHKVVAERIGLIGLADHKDRNGLNNQRDNLRQATNSQNIANRGMPSHNTSGYKGIYFDKRRGNWTAKVGFNKSYTHLGTFNTAIEAAKAYDRAAKRLHGEFAVLNFPGETE